MTSTGRNRSRVQALRRFLAEEGPASGRAGREHLGISQAAFSNLVTSAPQEILAAGRGRATRYAARREISGVGLEVPIFAIGDGSSPNRRIAVLHPVEPSGFYLQALDDLFTPSFFDDLPWFLDDLRPSGYLGRLLPRRHPELGLPGDIRYWTAEHCLRYLTRYGWDTTGNLLCGEEAFRLYLAAVQSPPNPVAPEDRPGTYPRLAADVLAAGPVGSSAAGEHPKFLATRAADHQPLLVKFSPPVGDPFGRRIADLLVCEHLALQVLAGRGQPAARSEIVEAGGRVFLELVRFDRLGVRGRRGTLTLAALDAEFVGKLGRWSDTVEDLVRQRRACADDLQRTRFLEVFGRLIGNTDMHPGNLSFFVDGQRCRELAPAYDMLPMAYAPADGQLPAAPLHPLPPSPAEAPAWEPAREAAVALWEQAAAHPGLSAEFRQLASANAAAIKRMAGVSDLLP